MKRWPKFGRPRDRLFAARFGAGGMALATVAATFSLAACGGEQLCTTTVSAGLPGDGQQATSQQILAAAKGLPGSSTVTLPTGQNVRLTVGAGGEQTATPMVPKGGQSGFVTMDVRGDTYLIPDDAVPYLGAQLDPRLFDVSYLARVRAASPHATTLPVTVTHPAGGEPTAMSASAARQLGAQLAKAWHAGGARPAKLAGVSRVRLAAGRGGIALPATLPGLATAGASGGNLPRHTLTVTFTGTDGKPAAAVGWVQNLTNARFGTFFVMPTDYVVAGRGRPGLEGVPGPLKFSVPEGTYSLQFSMLTQNPASWAGADAALVVKPEVTVSSDTTVTLDARGTVPYSATVVGGVPQTGHVDQLTFYRGSAAGGGCGGSNEDLNLGLLSMTRPDVATTRLSASPTGQVTDGTLGFAGTTSLGLTADNGQFLYPAGPEYDLSFPYWGSIPSSLTFAVPAADFTAVHQELHVDGNADCAGDTSFLDLGGYVYEPWGSYQTAPGSLVWAQDPNEATNEPIWYPAGYYTDYVYSGNAKLTTWQFDETEGSTNDECATQLTWGPRFASAPGKELTEVWNSGPAVPTAAAAPLSIPLYGLGGSQGTGDLRLTANPSQVAAPAVRQDDNGMIELAGVGDSQPSHFGGDVGDSTVAFYRDGTLAGSQAGQPTGLDLPLLNKPADYRLDWTSANPLQNAATTATSWRFRSAPSDPAAKLPGNERCGPDASRPCSFLPLLFLNYDLPLSLSNQAQAGTSGAFIINVSHQQGAPAPTGVTVTVAASFDDGKTWTPGQPAASAGDGKFKASIDQPALGSTDGFASLRVTATDGAGNSVTQTIIRAYELTS